MTDTPDTRSSGTQNPRHWRNAEEPWPIWAALLVFLNIVVIAAMNFGLPGLVAAMLPATVIMLVLVLMIATGR
ncbi:MAG: hypothetical protein JJU42_07575 [Rhodobacteraceae bacterium]|nr:hypothetical protein [Paracoccaceae bacterium]